MNRSQRIRLVAACTVGLLALFVALIGGPVVGASLFPAPESVESMETLGDAHELFSSAHQAATIGQMISLCGLVVACICFVYIFVVLAAWFIGPAEKSGEQAARQSEFLRIRRQVVGLL